MSTRIVDDIGNEMQVNHPVWAFVLKRMFDVVISLIVLLTIWPLVVMAAVAVKLSSPGPIFYRGVRSGLYGKPFRIFKFRTMVADAERIGGHSTAFDDPRLTRLGKFLRKYKLDELPQLIIFVIRKPSE